MGTSKEKQEPDKSKVEKTKRRHPPWNISLSILGPFRKLFEPSQRLVEPYAKKGQMVADLGCRRGFYTLVLAKAVGPEGKVYAVDLNKKCIQTLQGRADEAGYHNIEAHGTTAADLSFIKDKSVDFILANGLL